MKNNIDPNYRVFCNFMYSKDFGKTFIDEENAFLLYAESQDIINHEFVENFINNNLGKNNMPFFKVVQIVEISEL
ncbi:hypothetical protein NYR60_07170 [Actinobacillus genomosp. 2]|uniref:hypothetical protein n=1 Tax=Actinobacillus genomosp. 2 TaxID=230709 RepID=UPI002442CCB0|nr:hypothetical protein [Actinobacillus genomosp. 2]WGE31638.1 hypothetical protein NYR60_07170 [Actinobacillus genomosp. 2]